ncbi:hypothetical protein NLI96_g7270 [Meripilus lineatus]|uniref:Uncharacterized protein n=1 Tax=Meripilus lineatus TaxID=2056292 RepID=A0AAD5YD42_9APHY|nr:hypothetical protein NLI96_g7270 [Physisporinus lineatus]
MASDDRDLAAVKQEDISDASLFNARNPEFNLDVLSRIMGVSNRLILSSLMKTCHVYYSIGVPSLLRFSVEIGRFESIEPFHEFMFSTVLGSRDSFRFLQDLTLYGGCHHPRSPKAVLDSDDANLLFYPHHFYHGISALGYLIALQKIVVCGSWMPLDWLRQLPFRRFTHSHGTATFYSVLRFNDVPEIVAIALAPSSLIFKLKFNIQRSSKVSLCNLNIDIDLPNDCQYLFEETRNTQSNTRVQPHERITSAQVSMALSHNDSDHGLTDKTRTVECGGISTTGTIEVKSGAPILNLDVVSSIMALSDRPSVSHLMKACRQYHSIGVPILLRFPVSFYALRFVDSFYLFMFTTTMDRFQFLKDVTIKKAHNTSYSKRKNHAYQSKILRILSHATSLEKLSLVDVDRLLDNFPDAISQLAGLTTLREVACADSRKLLDWVGQLRAPLTKLTFTLDDGNEPVDLLSTIPHFHATLRSLSVAYVFFDPDDLSLQLPLVNDLTVDTVYAGMYSACYSAQTIFRLFPNLKSLTFPDEPLDVNFLAFAQRDIRERHEEHMVAATRDGVVDKVLEELTGCIADLYRGAYICRVKDLSVHYLDDENALWLIPLLVHMQPSYLSLAFRLSDSGFGTMPALLQIFQEVSTLNNLRHLSLDLDFEEANYGAAQCIVEELPEVLRHVAITRLTITWWNVDEFTDNHDFLRREVDWREVVLLILLVAPTLRVVEIQTIMPPFYSTKVFRVPKNLVKKTLQRFKPQAAVMNYLRPRIFCSD